MPGQHEQQNDAPDEPADLHAPAYPSCGRTMLLHRIESKVRETEGISKRESVSLLRVVENRRGPDAINLATK